MFSLLLGDKTRKVRQIELTFWMDVGFSKSKNVMIKIQNYKLDVHESVHRDTTMKITNKMHCADLIYYSMSALHVSGDVFAHHQEHLTVFTVSGSVHPSCCRLPADSNLGEHYQIPLPAGRPARPRPTALLPPRCNGKTRGCYCSCWAPGDGREDARNMLSCT
jgi:hypothetical protein